MQSVLNFKYRVSWVLELHKGLLCLKLYWIIVFVSTPVIYGQHSLCFGLHPLLREQSASPQYSHVCCLVLGL